MCLIALPNVSESQGPTYTPSEEQVDTAPPTQALPAEEEEELDDTPPVLTKEYIIKRIVETFPEEPLMIYVAMCESGLDPLADRGNLNVDVGLFQINQIHRGRLRELGLQRRNLEDNLTFARMLYDEQGLGPWYMSEHCWSKYT